MRISGSNRNSLLATSVALGWSSISLCIPLSSLFTWKLFPPPHSPLKSNTLGQSLSSCPIPQNVWKTPRESFRLKAVPSIFSICLLAFHRGGNDKLFCFPILRSAFASKKECPFCWETLDGLGDGFIHLNKVSEC